MPLTIPSPTALPLVCVHCSDSHTSGYSIHKYKVSLFKVKVEPYYTYCMIYISSCFCDIVTSLSLSPQGSGVIKAGFAGDQIPKYCFPN